MSSTCLPADWLAGQKHLAKVDPVLRKMIKKVGPCTVKPRKDYFVVLCKAIFSQQISTAVAKVLFDRFCNQFPRRRPTPELTIKMLSGDPEKVRTFGVSRQKRAYLLDLASHFALGKLRTSKFSKMEDEEIIEALVAVKGIGRWTAEMFLIFVLNRPDVYPVDDLGLRNGVQRAYGLKETPTAAELRQIAEHWRPHRSLATWYFWRFPAPKVSPPPKPSARALRDRR